MHLEIDNKRKTEKVIYLLQFPQILIHEYTRLHFKYVEHFKICNT